MRAPSDPLGGGDPVSDGALLVHGEEDQPALPPHLHLRLVPCLAHGPWRAGAPFAFAGDAQLLMILLL